MAASDNSHELRQHGAWLTFAEVDTMVRHDPDALLLLAYLRSHSAPWGGFTCPNALTFTLGWRQKRLTRARARLIRLGYLDPLRPPRRHQPALYQWGLTASPYVQ